MKAPELAADNSTASRDMEVPVWLMGVADGETMKDELGGGSYLVADGMAHVQGLDGHYGAVLCLSTPASPTAGTR